MNYSSIIDENIGNVYRIGIAAKILQHMDRIRNVSDKSQARRWVMELLQNARDIAYEGKPVRVKILLDENKVVFSHNGRPFGVKNILSIINQVSSKNTDEDSIGKFGTGFVTTFQLSEVVEVKSVLKEENLPYKPFNIKIDRSGADAEEILAGINKTMNELKDADAFGEMESFREDEYNTSFIYHLDSEYSRDVAVTGINDLRETVLYIMLFSEKFAEIEIERHFADKTETTVYKRGGSESLTADGLGELCITEHNRTLGDKGETTSERKHMMLYYAAEDGSITLAVSVKDGRVLPLLSLVPRVFVDFPLIGAEGFAFPVVINSRRFKTNEPRSGITLVDNENSRDAVVNKQLMTEAVLLYREFLSRLLRGGYGGIENFIDIPGIYEDREMSAEWLVENIYKPVYSYVASEKILPADGGYVSFDDPDVYLLDTENDVEEKLMYELCKPLRNIIIPDNVSVWRNALRGYAVSEKKILTLERVIVNAQKLLKDFLDEDEMPPVAWCRKLYFAGMGNESIARKITAGELAVFPTQCREDWEQRRLAAIDTVYMGNGLPEELLDICDLLDGLSLSDALCIRKKLVHNDFAAPGSENQGELSRLRSIDRDVVYNYIHRRSDRSYRVTAFNAYQDKYLGIWNDAWLKLVCCGPDEGFYRMLEKTYENELPEYKPLSPDIPAYVWKSAYFNLLDIKTSSLSECRNIAGLKERYPKIADDCFGWLNEVIRLLERYMPNYQKMIYPDQNGDFKCLQNLYRDDINSEELKKISDGFALKGGRDRDDGHIFYGIYECHIYDRLLDKNIRCENNMLRGFTKHMVSQNINAAVSKLLSTQALSEADIKYQENCTDLLGWIQENQESAAEYFPEYCSDEEQMKLLTPRAAVNLRKKADEYNRLVQEIGTDNIEELKKLVYWKKEYDDWENSGDKAVWYDDDADVAYDDDFMENGKIPLANVGKAGELYALSCVKEYVKRQGYEPAEQLDDGEVSCFEKNDGGVPKRIEVIYRESGIYHQPGYDIQVRQLENGALESFYIEVKTHISRSERRSSLNISHEQMRLAAAAKENFHILSVRYDAECCSAVAVRDFKNPIGLIADGSLRISGKKYKLVIQ